MKITIETEFNPGDVVCRKNLVTNEAEQTKMNELHSMHLLIKIKHHTQ